MAVYPAYRSVLVVEPIGLTSDDMSLLAMEENPLEILQYFISVNDNEPRFKSNVYEDFIENFEFDEDDRKEEDVMCRICGDKFLFVNLLKNTRWAAEQAGCSNAAILLGTEKDRINHIKSKNKNRYVLIIPDAKFNAFKQNRSLAMVNQPDQKEKKKSNRHTGTSNKVLDVILSGVLGGKHARFTPTSLFREVRKEHPEIDLQMVVGACNTLVRHGDLARVPVLDTEGRPKAQVDKQGNLTGKISYAYGKYEINIETQADRQQHRIPVEENVVEKRIERLEAMARAIVPDKKVEQKPHEEVKPKPVAVAPVKKPDDGVTVEDLRKAIADHSRLIDMLASKMHG